MPLGARAMMSRRGGGPVIRWRGGWPRPSTRWGSAHVRALWRWRRRLSITRKTVVAFADRVPAAPPGPPEHPDYPRVLAVFNETTSPLRARDACEALDHGLLRKNIEGTRAKLRRLAKLDILAEVDTGSFTRKQQAAGHDQQL